VHLYLHGVADMSFDMTSRNLSEVEAVSGNDVLNPRLFLGEGSLDGAFVISGVRKTSVSGKPNTL